MLSCVSLKLRLNRKRTRFFAITLSEGSWPGQCPRDWQKLVDMRADGALHPVIGATLPLDQAAEAHALMDRAGVAGKIVLRCAAAQTET